MTGQGWQSGHLPFHIRQLLAVHALLACLPASQPACLPARLLATGARKSGFPE